MVGIWDDPEKEAEVLHDNGFLVSETGLLAYLAPDLESSESDVEELARPYKWARAEGVSWNASRRN
jgi:hypothetical protein